MKARLFFFLLSFCQQSLNRVPESGGGTESTTTSIQHHSPMTTNSLYTQRPVTLSHCNIPTTAVVKSRLECTVHCSQMQRCCGITMCPRNDADRNLCEIWSKDSKNPHSSGQQAAKQGCYFMEKVGEPISSSAIIPAEKTTMATHYNEIPTTQSDEITIDALRNETVATPASETTLSALSKEKVVTSLSISIPAGETTKAVLPMETTITLSNSTPADETTKAGLPMETTITLSNSTPADETTKAGLPMETTITLSNSTPAGETTKAGLPTKTTITLSNSTPAGKITKVGLPMETMVKSLSMTTSWKMTQQLETTKPDLYMELTTSLSTKMTQQDTNPCPVETTMNQQTTSPSPVETLVNQQTTNSIPVEILVNQQTTNPSPVETTMNQQTTNPSPAEATANQLTTNSSHVEATANQQTKNPSPAEATANQQTTNSSQAQTTELACQNGGTRKANKCRCPLPYAGETCNRYIRDCSEGYYEAKATGISTGLYLIQPTGSPSPFKVRCSFHLEFGVTQPFYRTQTATDDWKSKTWAEFKAGFGDDLNTVSTSNQYFIGLDKLHDIISQARYSYHIYITDNPDACASYENFTISSETSYYAIDYDKFYQITDPSTKYSLLTNNRADNGFNGSRPLLFSTLDQDHNQCAAFKGAGWYDDNCQGFSIFASPLLWPVNDHNITVSKMSLYLLTESDNYET